MTKIYLVITIFLTNIVFSQTSIKPVFEYFNQGTPFSAITVDKNNNIWVGTDRAGAYFLDQKQTAPSFSNLSIGVTGFELSKLRIQSLASDGLGNVWIAHAGSSGIFNGGGVERIDINSLSVQHFTPDRNAKGFPFLERDGIGTLNAQQVAVSFDNTVWVAQRYHDLTVTGMDPIIDPLTGIVTTFPGAYIITPGTFSFRKAGQEKFISKSTWKDRDFSDPLPYPAYTYNPPTNKTGQTRTFNAISADSTSVWTCHFPYVAAADIKDTEGQSYPSRMLKCDLDGNIIDSFSKTDAKFKALGGVFNGVYANNKKGIWVTSSLVDEGFSVFFNGIWSNFTTANLPNIIPAGTRFNNKAIWGNQYGNVFMGTNNGLIVYDGRGAINDEKSYTLYNVERHGLISNNIIAGASETIEDDSEEELDYKLNQWIATDKGIIKANIGSVPSDKEFKTDITFNETSKFAKNNPKNLNAIAVETELKRRFDLGSGVDKTYHKYELLTEICDKKSKYLVEGECVPCSREEVYKTMQQNSKFQIASPLVMSQDGIFSSLISGVNSFNEQNYIDILATINSRDLHIEFASDIFKTSSLGVQTKFRLAYLNPANLVETGILSNANQNKLDKEALNIIQNEENRKSTNILDKNKPIECKNDTKYRLYNSPAYIKGRGIFKEDSKDPKQCDYELENILYDPITMLVDDEKFTITNYTLPGHALYPGKVTRKIIEKDNKIYVSTVGVGYHFCAQSSNLIQPDLGIFSRGINLIEGPIIFKNADIEFKKYFKKI
jgi:hypothetical protein